MQAPIRYLADDLLEGRGPASRGDKLAQLYLATQLAVPRLRARAPGTAAAASPFDMVGITADMPKTWELQGKRRADASP